MRLLLLSAGIPLLPVRESGLRQPLGAVARVSSGRIHGRAARMAARNRWNTLTAGLHLCHPLQRILPVRRLEVLPLPKDERDAATTAAIVPHSLTGSGHYAATWFHATTCQRDHVTA